MLADRSYQCLGQWEEEGLTYTYTQRTDIPGYECFVGQVTCLSSTAPSLSPSPRWTAWAG